MLSLVAVLLTCFLVGTASTNSIAREYKVHSSFGLVIYIIATNLISSIFNWNVGRSSFFVICLSAFFIILRVSKSHINFGQLRDIVVEFFWLLTAAILISPFFLFLSKDIASRNFDAYYATQDGIFLSNHSVIQSSGKVTELLPLIWGADSSDRYGISFFTSFILFISNQNPWLVAKYIYIGVFTISIFTLRSLIQSFVSKNHLKLANILTGLVLFSPFLLLQSMYFMYGQTIALIFLPLFILITREYQNKLNQFWLMAVFVASFISYPAISLILGAIIFILLAPSFFGSENTKGKLLQFLKFLLTIMVFILVAFGFNLSLVINRVWVWLGGQLGLTNSALNTSDSIQIELFSQFNSALGLPLYMGVIPHPFTKNWNPIIASLLVIGLGWFLLYSFVYFYKYLVPVEFRRNFLVIVGICSCVPILSFIKGSGYVVFKTSTWFGPYILIILVLVLLSKLRDLYSLKLDSKLHLYRKSFIYPLISMLVFVFIFDTSFQYAKMFPSWNSFSQIPDKDDSRQLSNVRFDGVGSLAILSPTAEESTWVAGALNPSIRSKTVSLGQNEQALTDGLKTSCSLNKAQQNFTGVTEILYSDSTRDIVPNMIFTANKSRVFGHWKLQDAKNLEFAVVVNSGAFPPSTSLSTALPLKNQDAMRWSGGTICLGIFSAEDDSRIVDFPFYSLDGTSEKHRNWEIAVNSKPFELKTKSNALNFEIAVHKGWNTLKIRNLDCPTQFNANRLQGKADDRPLCIMYGKLVLTN